MCGLHSHGGRAGGWRRRRVCVPKRQDTAASRHRSIGVPKVPRKQGQRQGERARGVSGSNARPGGKERAAIERLAECGVMVRYGVNCARPALFPIWWLACRYCTPCFLKAATKRFMAAMSRNALMEPGSSILVSLSGGWGSRMCLHLCLDYLVNSKHRCVVCDCRWV